MTRRSLGRRALLELPLACLVLLGATDCKREARCSHCGMKIAPDSTWTTELTGSSPDRFDTPRCALTAWRKGRQGVTGVVVMEYYDRKRMDGKDVSFVIGSDVLGPMGPDLVAVSAPNVSRFVGDHGGKAMSLAEVTLPVLESMR